MTAVDVDALDKLREAIRDVLAGWSLGAGYYQYTVGTDDAREMADALLADALPELLAEVRRGRARDEVLKKLIAVAPVVWYGEYPVKAVPLSDLLSLDALAAVDGGEQ